MDNSFLTHINNELENGTEYVAYQNTLSDYLELGDEFKIPSTLFEEVLEKSKKYCVKPYTKESYVVIRSQFEYQPVVDLIAEKIEEEFETMNIIASKMMSDESVGYSTQEVTKVMDLFEYAIKKLERQYPDSKNEYKYSIVKMHYHNTGETVERFQTIKLLLIKK